MNRDLIIILLVILPYMGHGQTPKGDFKTTIVEDIVVEEIMEPPPPHLSSTFINVKDWLSDMCDHNKPKKAIEKFRVGLFESINDYTLFLVGINSYEEGKKRGSRRIEFEPKNMYFKLPKSYYISLTREQILEKLTSELKIFTKSTKFNKSFFVNAETFVFETNGTTLWTR